MRFNLEPGLRFHLRCALYIAFGAAFATLIGVMVLSQEDVRRLADTQRGFESETRRLQQQLDRRVAEFENARTEDLAALELRLKVIAERQQETDERAKTAGQKSPFPIDRVRGSIVELICIDNNDRETYYTGSGTVIDKSGLIITNQHLLLSQDDSLIRYCGVGFTGDLHVPPKIEYVGTAVAVHAGTDLALLRITEHLEGSALPKEFPFLSLSEATKASGDLAL